MNVTNISNRLKRKIINFLGYHELEKKISRLEQRIEMQEYLAQNITGKSKEKLVKIHFINMLGRGNCGDYNCGPYQFFSTYFYSCKCYFHRLCDIDFSSIQEGDYCIIGGGGLVNHSVEWNNAIEKCNDLSKHVIIWGAGMNTHIGDTCYKLALEKFHLVGLRDYPKMEAMIEYVPCPSCMLPELSYDYEICREIGVVEHAMYPIEEFPYEKINNSVDVYSVIKFIGTSSIIISNSYHAVYWATLMKKKVIIYEKFSSKFDSLKWKQPIYSGDFMEDVGKCEIYTDALEECRKININFAEKIKEIMEI